MHVPTARSPRLARVVLTAFLAGAASGHTQTLIDTATSIGVQNTLNQISTPNLGGATQSAQKAAAAVQNNTDATKALMNQVDPAAAASPAGTVAAPKVTVTPLTDAQQLALQVAYASLKAGKLNDARRQFEAVIAQNFNNPEPHFGLALTLLSQKDDKGAIFELLQFRALAPERYEGPYNLGVIAARAGRYEDAMKYYGEAATLVKDDPATQIQVFSALAGEQGRKGDFAGLVDSLTRLVALNPKNLDYQYRLAQAQVLAGQGAQALPQVYAVLQQQPGRLNAVKLLADLYVSQGLPDRAVREMDAAMVNLRSNADRADLLLYKANLLAAGGDTRAAVLAAKEARQQDPKNLTAYLREGEWRLQRGDRSGALAVYQAAAKVAPRDGSVLTELSSVELVVGQYASAAQHAEQALRLKLTAPGKAKAQYVRGVAAFRLGQHAVAKQYLSASALGAATQSADTLLWLGLSNYTLKDYPAAVAALTESVKLNPSVTARQNLASALLAAARYTEAEALLQGLVKDQPSNSEAWYFLGMSQRLQQKDAAAKQSLRTAANLGNARAKDALK